MGTNGKGRPPRPQVEVISPTASPSEAAAIVAALERFLADTAPAPPPTKPRESRWQRVALEEGVSARDVRPGGWGDPSQR